MELKDIVTVIKELVLPELKEIRYEQAELKTALTLTNKRLDDVNTHLADQSRRIDETNKRIDEVRTDLTSRIDDVILRIDKTNDRLNRLYEVIVRRDDHEELKTRVERLEHDMAVLKQRLAA